MSSLYFDVAPNVWGSKDIFVNFYFVKDEASDHWTLVDTGLKTSTGKIKKIAAELFGEEAKPNAIILTHGHFDHVGAVAKLAEEWHVPVYAHYLEMPFLIGRSSYPPGDPTVGGGLMASLAGLYPRSPIDIEGSVEALPEDGTVPGLPDWKWIHTPGHAPGHISLFRESDKVLIAGDAFVTTKSESAMATIKQPQIVSGPPKYFTPDWIAAEASVKVLAALEPTIAATGHGKPMEGEELQQQLQQLADNFNLLAIPPEGRYVDEPALFDASGTLYVPPKIKKPVNRKQVGIIAGVAILAGVFTYWAITQSKKKKNWFS